MGGDNLRVEKGFSNTNLKCKTLPTFNIIFIETKHEVWTNITSNSYTLSACHWSARLFFPSLLLIIVIQQPGTATPSHFEALLPLPPVVFVLCQQQCLLLINEVVVLPLKISYLFHRHPNTLSLISAVFVLSPECRLEDNVSLTLVNNERENYPDVKIPADMPDIFTYPSHIHCSRSPPPVAPPLTPNSLHGCWKECRTFDL